MGPHTARAEHADARLAAGATHARTRPGNPDLARVEELAATPMPADFLHGPNAAEAYLAQAA